MTMKREREARATPETRLHDAARAGLLGHFSLASTRGDSGIGGRSVRLSLFHILFGNRLLRRVEEVLQRFAMIEEVDGEKCAYSNFIHRFKSMAVWIPA